MITYTCECPVCGQEFTRNRCSVYSPAPIFCSQKCRGIYQSRMMNRCFTKARTEHKAEIAMNKSTRARKKKLETSRGK